jgi:serine/threonine-protein kinase
VIASSPGLAGYDPWDAVDTVISADSSGQQPADAQPDWRSSGVAGQRLGRYRLIARLGRGCQGDVWRAVPEDGGPDSSAPEVALKLLPPNLARDPRRLAQFRREAERRARLAVPSVLPTSEYGESDGILFMAMPLVDGCSLGEVIAWKRRSPGQLRESIDPRHPLTEAATRAYLQGVVHVVAHVARTLDHVHKARVVHRDIKPANILLDRHRREGVFLCDFGLARDLDVATPEQLRDGSGTPLYMAPERLLRLFADEILCDIYALGATLYEALTLVPPVSIPENLPWPSWSSYLASTKPAPPRYLRPEIPETLEAIVLRCLAHEADRRYPAAAELASDLEAFLVRESENDRPRRAAPTRGARPRLPRRASAGSLGEHSAPADAAPCWLPAPAHPTHPCQPHSETWKTPIAAE